MKRPRPVPGLPAPPFARPNFSKITRLLVARDARPAVAHARRRTRPFERVDLDVDRLARVRLLHRVLDQVPEHLPQARAVAAQNRGSGPCTFARIGTSSCPSDADATASSTSSPTSRSSKL